MTDKANLPPIAVVGLGTLFPGRGTTVGFWRDIVEGVDTVTDVPETHWLVDDYYDPDPSVPDKTYSRHGAFIPHFAFDPMRFGTPPQVLETTDTVQLLALYVADQVLKEARSAEFADIDPDRTSVVLGVAAGTELIGDMSSRLDRPVWVRAMREHGLSDVDATAIADRISSSYGDWRETTFPGLLGNVVAGRIANRLDLGGTNFTTDAACASSLAAVRHAAQELWLGESDMVLAGGADALNNIFMFMCFSKTPAMSAAGTCRPFSADSDGTVMGEGCGIMALRRLEDAERDGNTIYAVIRGIGASSDGKGTSIYAPRAGGQARAVERAYQAAGYSPRTVELTEAHGTGTRVGDATEFEGLRSFFSEYADGDVGWCALGSVKSQIGHTKSAAGAASFAKVISALHHKVLPPTINVTAPNPKLGIEDSPFYLSTEARPWIRGSDHPRRASVSSFGFGGSNFHLAVEEYTGPGKTPARYRTVPTELFTFSGASPDAAAQAMSACVAACTHDDDLAHHAHASQMAFDARADHRVCLVAGSAEELASLAEKAGRVVAGGKPVVTERFAYGGPQRPGDGKVGFLFSGQGSQYVGMGADLAINFDAARAAWDEASDYPFLGTPKLHEIAFPPVAFDDETRERQTALLTQTENAQPGIGLVALAQLNLLRDLALTPDCTAGHSFGEVMALHSAGAFDARTAVSLARQRGLAMAQAAGGSPGAMLAVFAGRETVEPYLSGQHDVVIANDNAQTQVVLSGPDTAIGGIAEKLDAAGLRVQRLNVSAAFHSPSVAEATGPFRDAIVGSDMKAPQIPVYSNTMAERYPDAVPEIQDVLAAQIASPVRFRDMIETMYRDGVRTFVEVGPGNALSGFAGSILGDRPHVAVSLDSKRHHDATGLDIALATLCASGRPLNLKALWADAPAPTPRPEVLKHHILLNGANYGKPAPGAGVAGATDPDRPTLVELRGAYDELRIAGATPNAVQESIAASHPVHGDIVPTPPAAPAAPAVETSAVAETVRSIVGEKTGYPTDMLDMEMDLEAELGIDSIKQVEILSALRETMPDMPEIDPARLAELRTLAQIAEAVAGAAPHGVAEPAMPEPLETEAPKPALEAVPVAQPAPATSAVDTSAVAETVRSIVAGKTGYPTDMLDMEMDLEAELGIDSIKQVEILSALRETMPDMPEIDPARLAELRTLAQIAEAVAGATPSSAPQRAPDAPMPEPPKPALEPVPTQQSAPSIPAVDTSAVAETVRSIVAEKTGYPTDMLDMEMDLEAELGIDSIKQVEILSALRETMPDMPEIDPARLAELRTLAQIAEAVAGAAPSSAPQTVPDAPMPEPPKPALEAVPVAQPAPALPAVDTNAVAETVRSIVAEKTGYPTDMLDMEMDLEAELGIDSIKQVEILSALRETMPDMPEVDPARLAELRTLAQIAEAVAGTATQGRTETSRPEKQQAEPARPRRAIDTTASEERFAGLGLFRQAIGLKDASASFSRPYPLLTNKSRIEITAHASALARAIQASFERHGLPAAIVETPSAQVDLLVVTAGAERALAGVEMHRQALQCAKTVAPAMTEHGGRCIFLQDTGGDFGHLLSDLSKAETGGIAGLAKTASHEWPKALVRAIDIGAGDPGDEAFVARIAKEILFGGDLVEVGLLPTGRRITMDLKTMLYSGNGVALADGDLIVVSGGGRSITAEAVCRLAREAKLRFLLLGRSDVTDWPAALPKDLSLQALRSALVSAARDSGEKVSIKEISARADRLLASREIDETISRIREAGSEAVYRAVDITDAGKVGEAVRAFKGSGRIAGLIHGAGVNIDKLIKDKTEDQLRTVYSTKVDGFKALWSAVEGDRPAFVSLFSSIAGRFGNPGQADYAIANEALSRIAWSLQNLYPDMRVSAIDWGGWLGGMVTDTVRRQFEERGVPLIPIDTGVEAFVLELIAGQGATPEVVFAGTPDVMLAASNKQRDGHSPSKSAVA